MPSIQSLLPQGRVRPVVLVGLIIGAVFVGFLGYSWLSTPSVSKYYGVWRCDGYAGPNLYEIGPNDYRINGVTYPDYSARSGPNGVIMLSRPAGGMSIENRNGRVSMNGYGNCSRR